MSVKKAPARKIRRRSPLAPIDAPQVISGPLTPVDPPQARIQIAIESCLSVSIQGCKRVTIADDGATILVVGEG